MKPETRELIDRVNRLWDRANAECNRISEAMALIPIDHPLHVLLNDDLTRAQAARREAGDQHAALLKLSFDEFDAEMKSKEEVSHA